MKKINLIVSVLITLTLCSCSIYLNSGNAGKKNKALEKTALVEVIPLNTQVTIPDGNNLTHIGDVFWENRTITLSGYWMGKYEVTQGLYDIVTGGIPYTDQENTYQGENCWLRPVTGITWYDAVYFCNQYSILQGLDPVFTITSIKKYPNGKNIKSATVTYDLTKNGYRLHTEAEWEYAARGAGKTPQDWTASYSGGNNIKLYSWTMMNSSGIYDEDATLRTHEVGLKKPNALGIYDMTGNASEWCLDYYRSIAEKNDYSHGNAVNDSGEVTDPVLPKGNYDRHVKRGGSYLNSPGEALITQRYSSLSYEYYGYDIPVLDVGFRLVRRPYRTEKIQSMY